jgi:hypothetical protein
MAQAEAEEHAPADAPRDRRCWLLVLAAVAVLVLLTRVAGCFGQGWPYTFFKDEDNNIRRSLRLAALRTLDPDWFNKPAFGYYVWVAEFGAWYGVGRILGKWSSPEEFGPRFLVEPGPFLAIGRLSSTVAALLTALLVARIGRRRFGPSAGAAAAVVLALMPGHVGASQEVKKDVLTGLLVLLSVSGMLAVAARGRPGAHFRAGFWAGVGTGTKYYPIALFLPFAIAHGAAPASGLGRSFWRRRLPLLLGGLALVLGFFLASPYSFLNPRSFEEQGMPALRFLGRQLGKLRSLLAASPEGTGLGPGAEPGMAGIGLALRRLLECLSDARGVGTPLLLLAALGLALGTRDRFAGRDGGQRSRGAGILLLGVTALWMGFFMALASPILQSPRHLAFLHPLVALLAGRGVAGLLAGLFRALHRASAPGAGAGLLASLLLALPAGGMPGEHVLQLNHARLRPDPRVSALRWIEREIPERTGIISDRDWIPLVASPERCEANLRRISGLERRYLAAHDAALALDPGDPTRSRRLSSIEKDLRLMRDYRVEARFERAASALGLRPGFDVLVFDKDWYFESLRRRIEVPSGYSPLWPRSPYGDYLPRVVAELPEDATPEQSRAVFGRLFEEDLPRFVEEALAARGLDAGAVATRREEELARARERFFPEGGISLVEIWRVPSPASAPWLPPGPWETSKDWFVSIRVTYENYLIPSKRAAFPDWAEFYAELNARYSCLEFGSEYLGSDHHRTVRIWDLRRRTGAPLVERVPENPKK